VKNLTTWLGLIQLKLANIPLVNQCLGLQTSGTSSKEVPGPNYLIIDTLKSRFRHMCVNTVERA